MLQEHTSYLNTSYRWRVWTMINSWGLVTGTRGEVKVVTHFLCTIWRQPRQTLVKSPPTDGATTLSIGSLFQVRTTLWLKAPLRRFSRDNAFLQLRLRRLVSATCLKKSSASVPDQDCWDPWAPELGRWGLHIDKRHGEWHLWHEGWEYSKSSFSCSIRRQPKEALVVFPSK